MLSFSSRTAIAAALFLAALTAIAIPRLVVASLVIVGLGALLYLGLRNPASLRRMIVRPVPIALAAFSICMALTSLWALDGQAALEKAAAFFTLSLFAVAGATVIGVTEREDIRVAARWFIGGLLAGLCYLTLEYAFGLPVTEFLAGRSDALIDSLSKHESVMDGEIQVSSVVLNKNITIFALAFVPALLLTCAFAHVPRQACRVAMFVLAAFCAWMTESGTAIAAIVAGAGLLLLGKISVRALRLLVVTGWVVAVVLAVPLCALPAKVGATDWSFLPKSSVRARFYIWSYAVDKVMERPLTGIGVRSTRELQPKVSRAEANSDAYRYRARPGRHTHNGFLQVWLEMGAIGAALLLVLGLAGLKAIGGLPPQLARYGYATFASMSVVAAFGYGIWQTWLLAGFFSVVLLYLLGVGLVARPEPEQRSG